MSLPPSLSPDSTDVLGAAAAEIDKLMALHPKGFDLGLGRVRQLLDKLANPQDRLPPVIHIAGTNGKGSCAAFCRAILESAGYSTHVHTSPHLVRWHERYRLGQDGETGKLVSDTVLAETVRRVADANGGEKITVFEILTAVMFVLFSEHAADAAVVEVGLGGRGDATNVIERPAATVFMPVSLDHEAFLGSTIEAIAAEKAGIIKPGVPVIIGAQPHGQARDVIEQRARQNGCPLFVYGQDYLAFEEHGRMVFQHPDGLIDLPLPALPGRHQFSNAAAALMAVRSAGFSYSDQNAETALRTASWPARMQILREGTLVGLAPEGSEIWLDGGHNPDAARVTAEFLANREDEIERPLFIVAGMINTKDAGNWFRAFQGMARHVFTVPVPSSEAAVEPSLLAAQAAEAGLSAEPVNSVAAALSILGDGWSGLERAPRILIGGSLYLAGDVLRDNGTPPV